MDVNELTGRVVIETGIVDVAYHSVECVISWFCCTLVWFLVIRSLAIDCC